MPLVAVKRSGRVNGGYAYWVGDLGVKAQVALGDDYSRDSPRRGIGSDGMERMLNAQDVAEELIDGLNELKEDEARRTVSDLSTGLNPLLGEREDFIDFGRRFRVVSFRWLGEGELECPVRIEGRDDRLEKEVRAPFLELSRMAQATASWRLASTPLSCGLIGQLNPERAPTGCPRMVPPWSLRSSDRNWRARRL